MKKRILALSLALLLLSGCSTGNMNSAANGALSDDLVAETSEKAVEGLEDITQAAELDASAGVLVTDSLDEYENGEVFIGYIDGTFEVLTFETEEDLSAGLDTLLQDETVTLIQPNYSYENKVLATTDALVGQQWALYNDGSFEMEEQQNRYPVYDSPFETPHAPGQWNIPDNFGRPGGFGGMSFYRNMSIEQETTAVAGIDINAEEAWSLYNGGSREVVVALIDTGVDYTHEDLAEAIWINESEIAGNNIDDDGNGYVDDVYGWNFYNNNNRVYASNSDDSHGTHGAGTIAANANNDLGIAGIVDSDQVKIMSLKALGGSDGSGTTASIIKAIQYAEANGASICNLSLGSSTNDRALYQAIASSSMLFVVASGNDAADTDKSPCYPASYDLDNIISVANLNYNGSLHYSSNYGAKSVDLAAPGSYILSTTPDDGYSYMTGTSMAAPVVTAAAAMIYSHHDSITLADVKEILLSSATELESLSGSTVSGGMLNLGAAMAYDLDELSGTAWETPSTATSGNAPEITVESRTQQGNTYLVVTITDADNDVAVTAYSTGILSAEQFLGGAAGVVFQLAGDGSMIFSVRNSGIYTFYAQDSTGNETVQSISVTVDSPEMPSDLTPGGVGNWMGRSPAGIPTHQPGNSQNYFPGQISNSSPMWQRNH